MFGFASVERARLGAAVVGLSFVRYAAEPAAEAAAAGAGGESGVAESVGECGVGVFSRARS